MVRCTLGLVFVTSVPTLFSSAVTIDMDAVMTVSIRIGISDNLN